MTQNKSYETAGMDSLEVGSNSPIGGMFTSAIASGKALADDGELYDSVQTAVDNATGIVFVGEGTFNESVTISTQGLTLQGSGNSTVIDSNGQGIGTSIRLDASNVTLSNFKIEAGIRDGIRTESAISGISIRNITVTDWGDDNAAIDLIDTTVATDCIISNCLVDGGTVNTARAIRGGKRSIVTGCQVVNMNNYDGITARSDSIVANCIVDVVGRYGIAISDDSIAIGNRVLNAGDAGINTGSLDGIVANNRVSDSGNTDLSLDSTTTNDDNKTGSAN